MRRRRALPMMLSVAALLLVVGCDDGDAPVIVDPGGGTQDVALEQITQNPSKSGGDPIDFRATVTEDGVVQRGVVVTFTLENPPLTNNESFVPSSSPQTGIAGIANVTLSGISGATTTSFDVRARTAGGATDFVRVNLQP